MGTLEGYVEGMINLSGGGGGGTSDYEELENKPSINNVTLSGNKTTSDLNISYDDLLDKPYINNMPPSIGADIGDVLTHTSDGDNWVAPVKELPLITSGDNGKVLTVSNGDVAWDNVAGGGDDYTTTETVIGSYMGKPLYRKVIDNLSVSTSSSWVTITNIQDAKDLVDIKLWGYFSEYFLVSYSQAHIDSTTGTLEVKFNVSDTRTITRVAVEYTKTTD